MPRQAFDRHAGGRGFKILAGPRKNVAASPVLISHKLGIVAEACDRGAVMDAGHLVEQGHVRDAFAGPKHPNTEEPLRCTISLAAIRRPVAGRRWTDASLADETGKDGRQPLGVKENSVADEA